MPELLSTPGTLILWALVGYLLGSIPSGVLIARAMNLGDLRQIGSGNIGATNVLRTGNKAAAALTLLFDAGKGVVAVLLARQFAGPDAVQLAALASFVGHCFPVWLGFRGGKGVATFFGIIFALAWPVGIMAGLTWIAIAAVLRYSSLAALMAAGWTPIFMIMRGYGTLIILGVVLAALVYLRHWANIKRLHRKTEPKIGQK